jgi:hypothetical protein
MSDERRKLQMEVIAKGEALFTDKQYQLDLIARVRVSSGSNRAGDLAKKLGLDEKAKMLWKEALSASSPRNYEYESLLNKLGEEEDLRVFWQMKFETADNSTAAEEYGKKLRLDENIIAQKSLEAVLKRYNEIETRRQKELCRYDNSMAESVFRHDMSHAVNAAVSTGNLELIMQGYKMFMESVVRNNDAEYLDRLVGHYKRAREHFAAKSIMIDPKNFCFDSNILEICVNKAKCGDSAYSWQIAADVAELIADQNAEEYRAAAIEAQEKYEAEQKRMYPNRHNSEFMTPTPKKSFEELVAQGEYIKAFNTAKEQNDVEKARSIYQRATREALRLDWGPIHQAMNLAEFVKDEKAVKVYQIADLII